MGAFVYMNQKMYTPNQNTINLIKEKTDKFDVTDNVLSYNCNSINVANVNMVTLLESDVRNAVLSIANTSVDSNVMVNMVNYPEHYDELLYSISLPNNMCTNTRSGVYYNYLTNNAFVNFSHTGHGPKIKFSGTSSMSGPVYMNWTSNVNIGLEGLVITVNNKSAMGIVTNHITNIGSSLFISTNNRNTSANNSYLIQLTSISDGTYRFVSNYKDMNNNSITESNIYMSNSQYFLNVSNNSGSVYYLQNSNTFSINITTNVSGSKQYSKFVVNNTGPYWIYPNNTIKCLI